MPPIPIQAQLVQMKKFNGNDRVREFRLAIEKKDWIPFTAGQFCLVHIPHEGKTAKKAYSICSAPYEQGLLDLCIKHVPNGVASTWFWQRQEGDRITITLPYGRFMMKKQTPNTLMVCTGTGLAPFRSMIRQRIHEKLFTEPVTLIFGTRHEDEVLYQDEWNSLTREHPNFSYFCTLSRPTSSWTGEQGYVQDLLSKINPNPENTEIMICGFTPMIEAVQEKALGLGFTKDRIHFEKYG